MGADLEVEIGRTRHRRLAERTHGASGRALPELPRGVRVEEKSLQDTAVHDDVSPTGEPFGVEPPRGESSHPQRIVDDAQRFGTDDRSEPVAEEGHAAIDGRTGGRRREMADE